MMDQFPQRANEPYSLLWRGLIKSCPVCGERQLFSKWVKMVERCPKCNLRFERIEGHWVGAVGMNTIFCSSVSGTGDSFLCHVSRYSHERMGFCLCRRIWLCSLLFYPSSKNLGQLLIFLCVLLKMKISMNLLTSNASLEV